MLRSWSAPAVPLVWFLACASPAGAAASRPDFDTPVTVQTVTADALEQMPSCARVLSDLVNIAPAPALNVAKSTIKVPMDAATPDLLHNLRIRTRDGVEYPARDPICVDNIEILRDGAQAIYGADGVAGTVNFIMSRPDHAPLDVGMPESGAAAGPYNFFAEPFLNPSQVQIIRGPFDTSWPGTSVDVGGRPGVILAETPQALFWLLPDDVPHGSISVTITDAGRGARFPVYVLGLGMSADQLRLLRGQSTQMQATVFGPDLMPADAWKAGDVSATVDLALVGRLFPDFRIPRPGDPGVLFLRIDNVSRDTVSMKPSKNESFLVNLTRGDFASGPYTYRARIQSKKAGGFTINGLVVGFFAPIPGEPWTPPDSGVSGAATSLDGGR